MRLTKKKWHQLNNHKKDWFEYVPGKYSWTDIVYKLGELECLMEKYTINSVEELEHIILNDANGEQAFREYFETNVMPYRNLEQDLGIDLVTREKALQNGAWYKSHSRGIVFCPFVRVVGKGKALELKEHQRTPTLCAKTCDYGKTWALTKEQLE